MTAPSPSWFDALETEVEEITGVGKRPVAPNFHSTSGTLHRSNCARKLPVAKLTLCVHSCY
ncbi:hypothetical protein SAMN05444714_1845 [Yoonia litorea]|uniref:Uncharacterized protein n=1 Tax=Yoonia litorea TaxID=1123755 RepID=A0A1I6MI75_9RHOB|nr:hypothetical protein SAMN05444714_1845 [Yoonia litorea]